MKIRTTISICAVTIFFLLFSAFDIYGSNIDSLKLLTHSDDAKVRLEAYIALSNQRNLPSGDRIEYSQAWLMLAIEQKNANSEASAHLSAGAAYTDAGNYDKAVYSLQKSIQIYDSLDDKKFKARALEVLGRTYFYLKQPERSLEMMEESVALKIELGDPAEIGWSYIGLGSVHAIMGNFDEALELFLKSEAILEDLQNTENLSKVYNNIANIYFAKDELDKVLPYRLKALALDREANDEQQISYKTYNLAEYYLAVNQPQNALPYLQESISLSEKLQDKELLLDNYKLLTIHYILTDNHEMAQQYLYEAFLLSEELFSGELSQKVGEMQALYETEKAIKEKQAADIKLSDAEQKKDIILLLLLIAVIVLGVFIYIYIEKRRFNALLKSEVQIKTQELEMANIELKSNISLLTEAKEKAEESDRLKSAFLANMSHEIRTPMNGILGFTALLLEPDLTSKEKDEYIKIVHQSGQRMLNTVNDIVEISKIETGIVEVKKEETNFNNLLKELYDFYKPDALKKGLTLHIDSFLPDVSEIILTDRNKVNTILCNLLRNAIKFTENGQVNIGCRLIESGIECYVKDTGIGIPKDRQDAVFDRFVQADIADINAYQGAGIGLSLCKSYVEMLNGKIWVESEQGNGSVFYFSLPV